ncbi:histone deacetylase family protein [Mesorhizobium sp. YC-39]|uniref:histone deacetylase family protein n=1 Tax=unclassified Mesorhizobium TaxID=325217 RepID=UPI0021E95E1C|nr:MULTISPECIES: histone deacetylase family protein [unclassified Mesorhizobium]MCV3210827.1 histone deacetylase family protein [Mesorhizobium sp. YC-2]MCV3231061.1 histone deacetylase family protein [Mesorhizobium sp. YC-39]
MKTVYSPRHALQDAQIEFIRGKSVPSFEMPQRAELVLERIKAVALGPVVEPGSFGLEPLLAVHDPDFVEFLSTIWETWSAESGQIDAFPNAWPPPRSRRIRTKRPGAELGRYCIDMSSPIMAGTWTAVTSAADAALTATEIAAGPERMAFALCRPPGHHAGRDYFGGYCFINNAAVAAQNLVDRGARRVAVLDVDYHHGNGTQDIFYERADVLVASIHADPETEYPYYSGYADETGDGPGEGFNLNVPLAWGSAYGEYKPALDTALARIAAHGTEALVVSLGVDTFDGDPISRFKLQNADFLSMGRAIASLGVPTVFVMEGGYAVADIGVNTVNVLTGFEDVIGS